MTPPKVSVIIPTYNRSECICDAIESVFTQTYRDYEVILIDDGSTDETRHVLARYGEKIRYIYQKNAGVSAARNRGIREARGDWIAFLDSDDEWLPEKLQTQMKCLELYQDVCGVMCDVEIVSGKRVAKLFELRGYQFSSSSCFVEERPLLALLSVRFFPSSWLLKRVAVLNSGFFNPQLSLHEDIDFAARVALQGPWCIHNAALVKILRKTPDNLSVQHVADPTRTPRNQIHIFHELLKLDSLTKLERHTLTRQLSDQYFSLGLETMRNKRGDSCLANLWKSLWLNVSTKSFVKVVALTMLRPGLYGAAINFLKRNRREFRRSEIEHNAADS